MSKNFTLNEALKEIASAMKLEIAKHEATLVAIRKKELERSHGKLAKSESLCPLCAEPDVKGKCGCLNKSEKLAKKTPPDISEKTMHKLKDEYGHDESGKEKAYATAWSIENKMKKDEMGDGGSQSMMMSELCLKCGKKNSLCKCMGKKEEHLDKAAMASSSASALAPKPETVTPAAHVNKELGGFKSIASKPAISSMGRQKASASGSFTTVKSEMKAGKAENYSEEANGGKTKKAKEPGVAIKSTSPKSKKPGKLPVPSAKNYSEKANGNVTKMEIQTKPDKDVDDSGSGGATKKGPSLKKSAVPSVKQPAVVGTAGKQPVGLGGGDANKIAGAPHPATTAGLADVKGLSPAGQWKGQGLPQLQTKLAAVRGGAGWLKSTHAKAARVHPAQAAPKSQRFHGALPLQRSETPAEKEKIRQDKILGDFVGPPSNKPKEPTTKAAIRRAAQANSGTKKMEMPAPTEGVTSVNHNRRMLKA